MSPKEMIRRAIKGAELNVEACQSRLDQALDVWVAREHDLMSAEIELKRLRRELRSDEGIEEKKVK